MALLLPKTLILHIPKTGSAWVRSACHASVSGPLGEVGEWHTDLQAAQSLLGAEGCALPLVGTFVRHPLEWYRSAWQYWRETGRFPRADDAPAVESPNFERFVRNCLRVEPEGYVTRLFERFTGSIAEKVVIVGRQESLADDLVRLLRLTGETFDEPQLRSAAPMNVRGSRNGADFPGYSTALVRDVLKAEQQVVDRYDRGRYVNDLFCVLEAYHRIGWHGQLSNGMATLEQLWQRGGLRENGVIVDIGCGFGRVAAAASFHPSLRYIGLEVREDRLQFCRSLFPAYEFNSLNVRNPKYSPEGTQSARRRPRSVHRPISA